VQPALAESTKAKTESVTSSIPKATHALPTKLDRFMMRPFPKKRKPQQAI
jgi:hypothetical protein